MKTKEQIQKYNKEYFARPEVKERAKIRNSQRREKRKMYKKTEKGKIAERRYLRNAYQKNKKQRTASRYGISLMFYDFLLITANGHCEVCGKEIDKHHVDHNHKNKKVRGILCMKCNMAIGLLNDDVSVLEKAIKYLNRPVNILQTLCIPTQQPQKELPR
jgi:hypothetical protein